LSEMQAKYEEEKVSKTKLEEDMSKLREFYDNKLQDAEGKYISTSQGKDLHMLYRIPH